MEIPPTVEYELARNMHLSGRDVRDMYLSIQT